MKEQFQLFFAINWNIKYLFNMNPWDTGVIPPEIVEIVEDCNLVPGSLLDVGCGSGTQSVYFAKHGFDVTGIDVASIAVLKARRKAFKNKVDVRFINKEFTKSDFKTKFDTVLDVGCLHGFSNKKNDHYFAKLKNILSVRGSYLLYAWDIREYKGKLCGVTSDDLAIKLGDGFVRRKLWKGEEHGRPAYWYWFVRRY